jgi:3-isopropylmalate/(R)-2-methylmalate dehydratase small subunit
MTGLAAPLLRANLDTDVIVRIDRLTTTDPAALARHTFEALRYLPDGEEDPAFVLNRPPFRGAAILVAGANFGCGSSREGAVWALRGLGVRCIIAPSFGDIFWGNCFQSGLLPITLAPRDVEEVAEVASRGERLTVDLTDACITTEDGRGWAFSIPALLRRSLLEGLDDLELTLQEAPRIEAWEARDRLVRPWVWDFPGGSR